MSTPAPSQTGTCAFQNMAEHDASALVQTLRADRIAGDTELPCFPQSAVRLQHLLSDSETDLSQVIQVISFDAVLTGRVLQLANSAALNTTGRKIHDLKTAVGRVGFDMVRSAVVAHGLQHLARALSNAEIRSHLEALWERSAWMAAMSYTIAKRFSQVNADQAMLAGLLHGVGKLYVISRAARHPFALHDRERFRAITREWQPQCAKSVLTAWRIASEVTLAVTSYENLNRSGPEQADLADVLTVSYLTIGYAGRLHALASTVDKIQAFARMQLNLDGLTQAVTEAQADIEALRHSLG